MSATAGCSSGCENTTQGMRLTCTDAVTGAPICNATVVAVSGGYRQQLTAAVSVTSIDAEPSSCVYSGLDSAGTFNVTVAAAGYEAQTVKATLTATSDQCGVNGGQVDVALVATGDGAGKDAAVESGAPNDSGADAGPDSATSDASND